jgi:hypothetical protein
MLRGVKSRTAQTVGVHPSTVTRRLEREDNTTQRVAKVTEIRMQTEAKIQQLNEGNKQ